MDGDARNTILSRRARFVAAALAAAGIAAGGQKDDAGIAGADPDASASASASAPAPSVEPPPRVCLQPPHVCLSMIEPRPSSCACDIVGGSK